MPAYTASQAQKGMGTLLEIGATPTTIGEVDTFPFDRPEWNVVDVTNSQSGSDSESVATIREGSEITFTGNRVSSDAGQTAVEAAYQTGVPTSFTLQLLKTGSQATTGDKYTFNAIVRSFNFNADIKAQIKFTIKLKLTGPAPLTQGA